MEVRPGYKQTEVGVIPEDWEVSKLAKNTTFKTGPFGSALHQSDYVESGVPVINPMQIMDGKIVSTPSMAVTEAAARKLSEFLLSAGDLIIGRRGEMGRCAMVRPEQHGWLCGTGSMIIRTGPSVEGRFVRCVLSSPPVIAAIENASVGSTMINLNQATLGNLLVSLPPTLAEQEAIAEALSDADALTESLEQLIAKKRDLKQGAMQELLTGKKRLPGFSGEWEVVKASDIGRFRGGSGFPTKFQGGTSGEYPFFKVTMNNEGNETFLKAANNYISDALRRQLGATAFPANSIVFAKVGAAVFLERKKILAQASCLDNNMAAFVLDANSTDHRFIHYALLNKKLGDLVSTTALPSLSGSVLAAIEFVRPPLIEQTAIAAILSDTDVEIAALEQKLAKTRNIKQGMMQELLTGRIRLV